MRDSLAPRRERAEKNELLLSYQPARFSVRDTGHWNRVSAATKNEEHCWPGHTHPRFAFAHIAHCLLYLWLVERCPVFVYAVSHNCPLFNFVNTLFLKNNQF